MTGYAFSGVWHEPWVDSKALFKALKKALLAPYEGFDETFRTPGKGLLRALLEPCQRLTKANGLIGPSVGSHPGLIKALLRPF